MKKLIFLLSIFLFIPCVNAWTSPQEIMLDYQYIDLKDPSSTIRRTSSSFGAISVGSYGWSLYKYGAYIHTPQNEEGTDWLIQPNSSYIISYTLTTDGALFNNGANVLASMQDKSVFNVSLGYFSDSNTWKWSSIHQANISYYMYRKTSPTTAVVSAIFTTGNLPSDINDTTWLKLDSWVEQPNSSYTNSISWTDGNTGFGITNYQLIAANGTNYTTYINDYNDYYANLENQQQNQTMIDQNQTIIDQNQTTHDKIDGIDSSINNSNVDDPSGSFSKFESYLPDNGVITDLITLPISLFQNVLGSINGTCTEYNLGNLMGTDLKLPCINISNYLGSTLWNVIDILFSGFFVLAIGKKMIKAFNGFTSMEEGDVLD